MVNFWPTKHVILGHFIWPYTPFTNYIQPNALNGLILAKKATLAEYTKWPKLCLWTNIISQNHVFGWPKIYSHYLALELLPPKQFITVLFFCAYIYGLLLNFPFNTLIEKSSSEHLKIHFYLHI